MATAIATVASLEGQAWAKAPDGTLRPLKVGDAVTAEEVVITAQGARIELDFGDGHPVNIAGGQEVAMNRDLWTDLAADNKDAAVDNASVQEALTVLNNGGDLTTTLEETAAGLSGGGSNEGHSFVELSRVVEETNPNAFNFGIANGDTASAPIPLASFASFNNAPLLDGQSFVGNEDTVISGRVIATDVENDALTYNLVGQPANGSITLDPATGDFIFTPNGNYNGPDSFIVTVTDDRGNTTTSTVNLTVTSVDDAPVSSNQNVTTPEDTPVSGQIVATDIEGDTLSYSISTTAANGTVTLDPATGGFIYTPNANYNGSDSFVVTVSDGNGGTTTSTVTVGVTPVNDGPVSGNQNLTTPEDTPMSGSIVATDADGDTLTYSLTSSAANGTVELNAAGGFVYTPGANFNGADSFVVTIADGQGGFTTSTINIGVTPVNDGPSAGNQNLTTPEDTPVSGQVVATDVEGDTLSYSISTTAAHGTVTLNPATGGFVYTPSASYNGADQFVVSISDGNGGVSTSTVNIGVTPVNDAPVSTNQNLTTPEDTSVSGQVVATDPDGDILTYAVSSTAANGSITLNAATGSFVYTPNTSYNGSDSFTVTINDGNGGVTTSVINMGVTPVNDAPVASNQSLSTPENTPVGGAVSANDPDGDTLAYSLTGTPAHGTVVLNPATGNFTYTPTAGFNGGDSFVVTVNDGNGGTTTSTVTVGVQPLTPVNQAPAAADDSASTAQDTAIIVAVRTNDTDLDGDVLTVSAVTQGVNGSVVIDGVTGNPVYTPDAGYVGNDSFTYTINDGNGHTSTATVNVSVTAVIPPVNSAPVSVGDAITVVEGGTATILTGGATSLLANDSDANSDPLTAILVTGPANGSLTLNANGTFSYTHNGSETTTDSFTYRANDGTVNGNIVTVNIGVTSVNDAPVAANDSAITDENTSVTIAVRTNDTDAEGNPVTVTSVTPALNGSVVIDALTGNPIYTPNNGFAGNDSFTYTINDGNGGTATATVNVTVNSVVPSNVAPVSVVDAITVVEGGTATILTGGATSLLTNDSDANSDPLTAILVTGPANGTLTLNANGTFSYTHNGSETTTDSFTYRANDGTVNGNIVTVNIGVTPVNDAPVAIDDYYTINEDQTLSLPMPLNALLANDTDAEGDSLSVYMVASPVNGSLTVVGGNLVFTPTAEFSGTASFSYGVHDGHGGISQATVYINVVATDDPTLAVADTNTIAEGDVATGNVLTNDVDPDSLLSVNKFVVNGSTYNAGDTAIIAGVGSVTLASNGQYTFTPTDSNYNGSVPTISYTTNTGASSTLNITVTPVNDNPIASDDSFTINMNSTLNLALPLSILAANDTDADGDTLSVYSVGGPNHGSFAVVGGNLVFTPDPGFSGVASFTYGVHDGHGGLSAATVNINVVNQASVLAPDSVTTIEDNAASGNVLTNDSDPDETLSIATFSVNGSTYAAGIIAVIPVMGSFTMRADGSYDFTPASNYSGPVPTVTYTTNTGFSSTLDITVTPVNDAPLAVTDNIQVLEGGTATVLVGGATNMLTNDTDADGDPLTAVLVAGPAHGSLTLNADGTFSYTHDGGQTTSDSFTYKANDGTISGNIVTVNISVMPVNDAPVTLADNISVTEGGTTAVLTGGATSVLANDFDLDGDALNAILVSGPTNGALTLNSDGTFSYTHNGSGTASDSFTYKANDGTTDGNVVTVNIGVLPPAGSLSLSATPSITEAGGDIIYTASLTNVQSSDLTVTLKNGEVITIAAGQLTGFVAVSLVGAEDVYIDPATVTNFINTVNGGNTGLAVNSSIVSTNITDTINTTTITLSSASSVLEGGAVVYSATVNNAVTGSSLIIHLDNGVDITIPVGDVFATSQPVLMRVDDAYLQGNQPVTVGISSTSGGNFEALNTASTTTTVVNDNGSVTSVTLNATGSVAEGGAIVYTATLSNAAHGPVTLTLSNGAVITITDNTTTGAVSVPVHADTVYADGASVSATIVNVTGGGFESLSFNTASATTIVTDTIDVTTLSISGAASIREGSSGAYTLSLDHVTQTPLTVTLNYSGVAANGTDINGATTITIPAGSSSTNFSIAALNDALTEGNESFTVTIGNTSGGGFESLVVNGSANSVTTTVVDNRAPDAINDSVSGASSNVGLVSEYYGVESSIYLTNVAQMYGLINSRAPDATFTATTFNYGANTNFSNNLGTGSNLQAFLGSDAASLSNDPAPDYRGSLIHMKGFVQLNAGTYNFRVLSDDGYEIRIDGVAVAQVNGNQSATTTTHSTFTVPANGLHSIEIVYWDQGGLARFKLELSNDAGVNYNILSSVPTYKAAGFAVAEDTPTSFSTASLLANDVDPDGDTLTITSVQAATHGTVSLVGSNVLFTPTANYSGPATFTYTVSDGHGGLDTAVVNLSVTAVNDAPVAGSDLLITQTGTAVTVPASTLLANDVDVDGDALFVSAVSGGVNGSVSLSNGSVTFTPSANFNGIASFNYTATDNHNGFVTGKVTVEVANVLGTSSDNTSLVGNLTTSNTIAGLGGNDKLTGNTGADLLDGGSGNDTMTGGAGADTFVWHLGDRGTTSTPALDAISDFSKGTGGDKLDLRDLLQNENSGNLTNYLHFTSDGTSTTISISSSGAFTGSNYGTATDQSIVLTNVNLTGGDTAIINLLKNTNNLITD